MDFADLDDVAPTTELELDELEISTVFVEPALLEEAVLQGRNPPSSESVAGGLRPESDIRAASNGRTPSPLTRFTPTLELVLEDLDVSTVIVDQTLYDEALARKRAHAGSTGRTENAVLRNHQHQRQRESHHGVRARALSVSTIELDVTDIEFADVDIGAPVPPPRPGRANWCTRAIRLAGIVSVWFTPGRVRR